MLQLDGHVADETFAARIEGEEKPVSTLFWLPPPPGAAFLEALASHVETFLATGQAAVPGRADAAHRRHPGLRAGVAGPWQAKRLETPDLDVSYDPPADSGFMRGDYAKPVR